MSSIIKFLGNKKVTVKPCTPFGNQEIDFLDSLSKILMSNNNARNFSDIISFAFWCRKKNIKSLKNKLNTAETRIGLGCIFHITPSNVPLNFAYSFAFGLLTGNSNIVKLPSENFPQTKIVCNAISKIIKKSEFKIIGKKNHFFKYNSNETDITKDLSSKIDGRVVWGGDKTVEMVKNLKTKPRTKDIFFSDRYSFCIIESDEIISAKSNRIQSFVNKFYNDTYFMDQNACSSPHLIVWYGSKKKNRLAKNKFWPELFKIVKKKYSLEYSNVVDKYASLCEDAIEHDLGNDFYNYENLIYRVEIKKLNKNLDQLNNKFGYFYEFECNNLKKIKNYVTQKFQTLAYLGMDKKKLLDFVIKNGLEGIDRIVPIGSSHNIGFIWDGYNIDKQLTRVIEVN